MFSSFAHSVRSTSTLARPPSRLRVPKTHTSMKRIFSLILISSLALMATVRADEQETVDHCANIIRDFRSMPEKGIPRDVLRHARGLAIITVIKAGFIVSAKAGHGVVVARTGHGWSGPSFIATGGAGLGLQAGGQATDFV